MDWSLYLVTDGSLSGKRSLTEVVAAALRGGAAIVQYREKSATTRRMVERAGALRAVCRQSGARFLVNDRIDVALAVEADGVHLGQDDMPASLARRLLGPQKLIGVTVHNEEELRKAEEDRVDYLSLAPAFATATKPDHRTPLGIEGVRALRKKTRLPTVVIGGIDRSNVYELVRVSGVEGVCVVSAVIAAFDPQEAAGELVRLVRAARAASL